MAEVTERDPMATRILILKEFGKVQACITIYPGTWSKLSFEAHKELCKELGADFIDYPEFEFWFSRFARGDFYLDYDRSSDPKTRSLTDLPLEVFKNVGEDLHLHEKLKLRDVCEDIRYQVDNWDHKVDEISYYKADIWEVRETSIYYSFDSYRQQQNIPSSFHKNPISFLMNILNLPKLQVEELKIDEEDEYWEKFIRGLGESNRKLHVKKVDFLNRNRKSKMDLQFMIPGVLEEIKMLNPKREEFYKIIESEQCQAAKMVYINSWTDASKFPLNALYNCPRFTLQLRGEPGTRANFLKNLMNRGRVQKCVLYISKARPPHNLGEIMKYFNEPEAKVPNFPTLRRYPIPETNEFYELEYKEDYRRRLCHKVFVHLERKQ